MPVRELSETILATTGIEGVTLTGGEPFEQSAELLPLVLGVRDAGLSVVAFTGFEIEELRTRPRSALLGACDIVITGRYVRTERSAGLALRGSANQTVHFLTDRYGPDSLSDAAVCEVHIGADGGLTLTGFPFLDPSPAGRSRDLLATLTVKSDP